MQDVLLLPAPPDTLLLPEYSTATIDSIAQALQKVGDAIRNVVERIGEVFKDVAQAIIRAFIRLKDEIYHAFAPKKWWHYYKHAKKRRVRKKYERRIRERILSILAEGGDANAGHS